MDSGGGYMNNIGGPVTDKLMRSSVGINSLLRMRTAAGRGYCTEKIMDAFAAATVPILLGAPDVKQEFNPAAFLRG